MHPLDVTLFLLLALWPLLRVAGWHRDRLVAMAFSLAVVLWLPIYLALDLLRWPIVPAVLLAIAWEVQAVGIMVGDLPPLRLLRARLISGAVGLALAVVMLLPPTLLLPRVPAFSPSGPFLVGVVDMTWPGTSGTLPDAQPALLPVRLWFPAEPSSKPRRTSRHRAQATFEHDLAERLPGGRGSWIVRGLTRAPLPIYTEMRLATRQRSYPVVILSHGNPGSPALLATLAIELASHGFVVATPEHLGASLGSVLPDGSFVPAEAESFLANAPARTAQITSDARATIAGLRALAAADSAGSFTARLRVDSIVFVGQGSSALAGAVLAEEGLVTGLVALDPPEGSSGPCGGRPVVSIARASGTMRGCQADRIEVVAPGAGPADFSDLAWWSPVLLRRAGLGGTVNAEELQQAVHQLTAAALRAWMHHEPADLRGLAESLPGVRLAAAQPAG